MLIAGSALTGAAPAPATCHLTASAGGAALPDPACTPGAIDAAVTQANIATTICRAGYTATVRPPVSVTDAFKVLDEQAYSTTGASELDHLVPLELGGSSDAHNLWVEPGAIPNPKDSVENELRAAVCSGRLRLALAQRLIAANWTTALAAIDQPSTTTLPAPATTATPSATASRGYVTPGAFCSVAGATGLTKTGKPEVCKTTATDARLRWRAS